MLKLVTPLSRNKVLRKGLDYFIFKEARTSSLRSWTIFIYYFYPRFYCNVSKLHHQDFFFSHSNYQMYVRVVFVIPKQTLYHNNLDIVGCIQSLSSIFTSRSCLNIDFQKFRISWKADILTYGLQNLFFIFASVKKM